MKKREEKISLRLKNRIANIKAREERFEQERIRASNLRIDYDVLVRKFDEAVFRLRLIAANQCLHSENPNGEDRITAAIGLEKIAKIGRP